MSERQRRAPVHQPSEGTGFVSVEALDQTLAAAVDGAFAMRPDDRVVLWNWMAEKILGWTAKDMIGRLAEAVFAGGREEWRGRCEIGDAVEHFETKALTKIGQSIWVDVSVVPVPAIDSAMRVCVFRDSSTTKALVETIQSLTTRGGHASAERSSSLTKREVEILRLMANGANTKALATRLRLSPATVRNHVQNIFEKLGVHSRLEAVAWANRPPGQALGARMTQRDISPG